jgi:flagellar biosynthesis chaperone FliJ
MSKSQLTRVELEEALKRLVLGKTIRIDPLRKISVKAVEEEANLGNGSAYYYRDTVQKIKETAVKYSNNSSLNNNYEEKILNLRNRLNNEIRLKEKYRKDVENLKFQLSNMATEHNQFALIIQQYKQRVLKLG